MDDDTGILTSSVMNIKNHYLVFFEDQFVQQFHDVGDALHDIAERCEGDDPYSGVSGGTEIAKLIIEVCEGYLEQHSLPDTL